MVFLVASGYKGIAIGPPEVRVVQIHTTCKVHML